MRLSRLQDPERVVAHLGPTNSGKTWNALQRLQEHGSGVYAAPLRLLAREAYEELRKEGNNVGLITGEEIENPEAPIICCTAEMAPQTGAVLVLDEVHWINEKERGQAWTRILLGGWKELHLIGSADVFPVLKTAFADLEVEWYDRLGPLQWIGKKDIDDLEASTAVVAFSRRNVLYIAGLLAEKYGAEKVGALYGAMPIDSRRRVVDKFRNGKLQYLVCTDVIGHGLNLPIETILFAETNKYDGENLREVQAWECAQIAGRAGRFGKHETGKVGVISGIEFFEPDSKVVKNSLSPSIEIEKNRFGYRRIEFAPLRPELKELDIFSALKLGKALVNWEEAAQVLHSNHPWLVPQDISLVKEKIQILKKTGVLASLDLETAWQLARAPVDTDDKQMVWLYQQAALSLINKAKLEETKPKNIYKLSLVECESAAKAISFLRWFENAFPEDSPFAIGQLKQIEGNIARRVSKLIEQQLKSPQIGYCESCGTECNPKMHFCDKCFANSKGRKKVAKSFARSK